MKNLTHRRPKSGNCFPKLRRYLPVFEKGQGRNPPSPLYWHPCLTSKNPKKYGNIKITQDELDNDKQIDENIINIPEWGKDVKFQEAKFFIQNLQYTSKSSSP